METAAEEIIAQNENATSAQEVRTCPDCGWMGAGNYCANCGEEMEPYLPKVRQFFHELASEFLALDSKIVRTIPALFRPGFLTQEYLAGRRKKYLLPWRLYSLIAILCLFEITHVFHQLLSTKPQSAVSVTQSTGVSSVTEVGTANDEQSIHNGRILIGYIMDTLPYTLLIGSVPLFALFLKIVYRKKERLYVEHLTFSFHFFACAALIFCVILISSYVWLLIPELILFFGYLYFALRRVY